MHTNRLTGEKSPYLLQHAHNPVDWYPWGPEAFDKAARREDKPIFLSIGYSTCHWCHVMERESFENEAIAAILNRDFVSIKVDREERPDVDRIYMTFVQATTGGGGWPMSVWLTPDLKPFFGGTYFPPEQRYGHPGFPMVLERSRGGLAAGPRPDRRIRPRGRRATAASKRRSRQWVRSPRCAPIRTLLDSAFYVFRRTFDTRYGGFGNAPKFPRPVVLNFLLRYYARTKNQEALDMALATLRAMAKGGMHDQLGGGFHRYSVDERWFVPHFEKMLYDQAQLAVSYLEAFQITHDPIYAGTARGMLDYVLRDMTRPGGGVLLGRGRRQRDRPGASAKRRAKARSISGRRRRSKPSLVNPRRNGSATASAWNATATCATIRTASSPARTFSTRRGRWKTAHAARRPWRKPRAKLARSAQPAGAPASRRQSPHRLERPDDLRVREGRRGAGGTALRGRGPARRGFHYRPHVRPGHRRPVAPLPRKAKPPSPASSTTTPFSPRRCSICTKPASTGATWNWPSRLTEKMLELFEDREHGAFFSTAAGDPTLVMRIKEDYDGAEPSGNSIAVLNLLRLAADHGPRGFSRIRRARAGGFRIAHGGRARRRSADAGWRTNSAWRSRKQIVLVGERDAADTRRLLARIARPLCAQSHRAAGGCGVARRRLAAIIPADRRNDAPSTDKPPPMSAENYACQLPTTDAGRIPAVATIESNHPKQQEEKWKDQEPPRCAAIPRR